MEFEIFKAELEKVKDFSLEEDYKKFDQLVAEVTGKEGIDWLNCCLNSHRWKPCRSTGQKS